MPNNEDILADPSARPYTSEIDKALRPHLDTLSTLLSWEPGQEHGLSPSEIPVLDLVKKQQSSKVFSHRIGVVPYIGNLSIDSRAQIHNWIDNNIPGAKANRHRWIARYVVAHAITLLIMDRMRPESGDVRKNEDDLLKRAWDVQVGSNMKDDELESVDVDAECLRVLERRLFEVSSAGGLASFYQWGLDAGDHEDRWDPYSETPRDWIIGDLHVGDEEEALQVCYFSYLTSKQCRL